MGKVIKILFSVLSSLILCIIILPLLAAVLLSVHSIQNFTVQQITKFVNNKLDVNISIDKIAVRGYNKIYMQDLYVEDLNSDTLLYISSLSANLDKAGIFKGNIIFGDINADSAKIYLYRPEDESVNLSQLIRHIKQRINSKPKKEKKKGDLILTDVSITNSVFKYYRAGEHEEREGIDFKNMEFRNMNISSDEIVFAGDSIAMELHDLSFIDRSGYGVDLLASDLFAFKSGSMYFRNMKILSSDSELNIPKLDMICESWGSYGDFADSVNMSLRITPSRLSMRTLSGFVRNLRPDIDIVADGLSVEVEGRLNNFKGSLYSATINDGTFVAGDYTVGNITNGGKMFLDLSNIDVRTDLESAELLYANIRGKKLEMDNDMRRHLLKAGKMRLTGNANVNGTDMKMGAHIIGDIGYVAVDGTVKGNERDGDTFKANIDIRDLNARLLTGMDLLGTLTMNTNIEGRLNHNGITAYFNSNVDGFGFDGRSYSNITFNGLYSGKNVSINMSSKDPKAVFDLSGGYNFADAEIPSYDMNLYAERIALKRLNVNPDSLSLLSCRVRASGIGKRLDDLNGRVNIDDVIYVKSADTVQIGSIDITAYNGEMSKSMKLDSKFMEITYNSNVGYKESLDDAKRVLWNYFPVMADEGYINDPKDCEGEQVDISVKIKQSDDLLGLIFDNVSIASGSELKLSMSEGGKGRLLTLNAPYLDYNKIFLDSLHVDVTNAGDSLLLVMNTSDAMVSGFDMSAVGIDGSAVNNVFVLSAGFNNTDNKMLAQLNVQGRMCRDDEGIYSDIGILPSYFDINGRRWNVLCNNITYTNSDISLDELSIMRDNHGISAHGIISSRATDTLSVRFNDVSLDMLNPIVDHYGYELSGKINGYADIMSVRENMRMDAEANIEEMQINDYELDPLKFESIWNTASQRVIFTLKNMLSDRTLVRSYHRSGNKAFLTYVTMGNIPLNVLTPVLGGAVNNVKGLADIDLELRNDLGKMMINGDLDISDFGFGIPFTSTSYTSDNITFHFDNSSVKTNQVMLQDVEGHNAIMEASADLSELSNIRYELKLSPDNLLVFNTKSGDGESFYGRLAVSGSVDVKGSRRRTSVGAVLSTDSNSLINVIVGGNSDFSIADYITFESSQDKLVVDTVHTAQTRHVEYQKRVQNVNRGSGLDVNMNLNVTPDLTLKLLIDPEYNNVLTANGNATLNVTLRPREDVFNVYGVYEISSGNYNFNIQNLIEKNFTLQQGSSILWTGNPSDAILDISAAYRLKTSIASLVGNSSGGNTNTNVDCVVNITNKLSSPQFSFDVELPNADSEYQAIISSSFSTQEMMATQFFYLLAFGTLYSDTSYGENLNIGASTGTSLGFDFLSSQIRNLLSAEGVNFNLRYIPKSTVNSDEYGFYFQNDLINDKLVLELEGSYDTGNNPMASSNRVSGGGTLTYYIDNSGNLVLKSYSRTIDRFDENQGLQENGIGLYYKEDFDNMSDLMEKVKRRFMGKNKREDMESKQSINK